MNFYVISINSDILMLVNAQLCLHKSMDEGTGLLIILQIRFWYFTHHQRSASHNVTTLLWTISVFS